MSLSYSSFSLSDLIQYPFLEIFLLLLGYSYFCPCILVTKCYIKRVSNTIGQLIVLFLLTNWWRWFTSLKFIPCKSLCRALWGWPWIRIIILVEHFRMICGKLLLSGLTMVLHWKMWLTIVEMKHMLVLVLSL